MRRQIGAFCRKKLPAGLEQIRSGYRRGITLYARVVSPIDSRIIRGILHLSPPSLSGWLTRGPKSILNGENEDDERRQQTGAFYRILLDDGGFQRGTRRVRVD